MDDEKIVEKIKKILEDMGLVDELEEAGVNLNNPVGIFNALHGAHRCEFAARISGKSPLAWNCLECKMHGFPLCDIECSVPCDECIRYTLCLEEGKVCEKCNAPKSACNHH